MDFNPNRIFRLGIRSKLVIAFLTLSTVPLFFSGLYAIHVHTQSLEHAELERLEHDVLTVRLRTATFLQGVEGDLRFLGETKLFRGFIETGEASAGSLLEDQIVDFARSRSRYYQVRYLDWAGGERFRVRADNGRYAAQVPDPAAPVDFYRHLLEGLQAGQVSFVPVELSGQYGTLVAALSAALVVADAAGEPRGALVADVFASDLFRIVEEAHESAGGEVALVSSEGHYLYHSERKRSWNQLLAARDEENLQRDHSGDAAEQIMSGTPGVLVTEDQVIAHAPLMQTEASGAGVYTLYMAVPRTLVLGPVAQFERAFYILLTLFTLVSIGLAFAAARQFTRPVKALQEEAREIAGGQFARRLAVDTYDEIQKLAETFNLMARAIEDREGRIRQHGAQLEGMVAERTAELASEKGKLQAILDSVPSAFVLLDRQLRVLSASSAFEWICGYAPATVVGRPYRLLCDCAPGKGFVAELALLTGKIHTDVQGLCLAGSDQPRQIERMAIPLASNGVVERVIEVLTDITERRVMEARIIQSEKLATTGEMAAVIAHEIRNSLTSVKMILQLELEREDLAAGDREALGVAADAVRRMESVVADLLRFARPTPPQLQAHDLNAVIGDSLAFIQHEVARKAVRAEVHLAPALPRVLGDADQLKEMFVNLLLNAVQAVDGGGRIEVSTEATGDGEWVTATVADDGAGIPPGLEERVFDPFYTTKLDGTGLGLSTARRTAEAHGGRIAVSRPRGGGARFAVCVPAHRDGVR